MARSQYHQQERAKAIHTLRDYLLSIPAVRLDAVVPSGLASRDVDADERPEVTAHTDRVTIRGWLPEDGWSMDDMRYEMTRDGAALPDPASYHEAAEILRDPDGAVQCADGYLMLTMPAHQVQPGDIIALSDDWCTVERNDDSTEGETSTRSILVAGRADGHMRSLGILASVGVAVLRPGDAALEER